MSSGGLKGGAVWAKCFKIIEVRVNPSKREGQWGKKKEEGRKKEGESGKKLAALM